MSRGHQHTAQASAALKTVVVCHGRRWDRNESLRLCVRAADFTVRCGRGWAPGREPPTPPLYAGQVSSSGSVAIALVVRIAPPMQTDLQCERQPVGGSMIG